MAVHGFPCRSAGRMLRPLTGMGDAARPERAVDPAGVEARSRAVNDVDVPAPEPLESGPEQTPLSSNAVRLELVSALPPEDPLKPAPPPPVARALSPRSLLMLQRSFGNAAVAELVRRSQPAAPPKPDPSPSPLAGEDRGFSPSASGGGQGGGPATTPHKPPAAPPPRPATPPGGGRPG